MIFRQYLLAQHMATSLSSSTADEPIDADTQKAITAATRLWHQTRHMKATILDKCRLYLKNIEADVQVNDQSVNLRIGICSIDLDSCQCSVNTHCIRK